METEAELAKVLTEFHQRNQDLVTPIGPPPPFEITTTVQQFSQSVPIRRKKDEAAVIIPGEDEQPRPETQFDFEFIAFYGTVSFVLQWWFRCHNEGTVGAESYIRVFPGTYWYSVNPPGYSGPVALAFNGSTWTPPGSNEQGTFVQMWITPLNYPPAPTYLYEAHILFEMYIEEAGHPNHISDAIYPVGNPLPGALSYYGVNHGLGINILWHDSP